MRALAPEVRLSCPNPEFFRKLFSRSGTLFETHGAKSCLFASEFGRSIEPTRFCSAKHASKQSTSCIVKKQVDPLIWTALIVSCLSRRPTLLENERGKRFNFEAILQVFLAEALHHKTLFSPGLQQKGSPQIRTPAKQRIPPRWSAEPSIPNRMPL